LPKRFVSFRSKRRVLNPEERARRGANLRDARAKAVTHDSADSDRRLSAEQREEAA
jgi:hypothetical protein